MLAAPIERHGEISHLALVPIADHVLESVEDFSRASGAAPPLVCRVLDIRESQDAHRLLEPREVAGKVILAFPARS